MPIKVKCACGKVLNAPDKLAGKKAKCPGCQQVITIPASSAAAPDSAETATCPSCQSPAPEGSVICIQCGYNFKTGQSLTTKVEAEPEGEAK